MRGGAKARIAKACPGPQHSAQLRVPNLGGEPDIQKPRAGGCDGQPAAVIIASLQFARHHRRRDEFSQCHRVLFDGPCQHHCGIGRKIAMRRVARRLDCDPGEIEPLRQRARGDQIIDCRHHQPAHILKNVGHISWQAPHALCDLRQLYFDTAALGFIDDHELAAVGRSKLRVGV